MAEPFRILSIDGGGIRGIIPAVWLKHIQDELDGKPLHECFDLVVGTSTGSIVAAAVACDIDVGDAYHLYEEFGPRIFRPQDYRMKFANLFTAPVYRPSALAEALRSVFGTRDLRDAKTKLCITSYDVFNRQVMLLKSYNADTEGLPIWECCKASSSAPSYFPAHLMAMKENKIPLIDGGVAANNPALIAIGEAVALLPGNHISELKRDVHLVSLGTGSMTRRITAKDAQTWGPVHWALPIIDVLFDASSDVTDRLVDTILDSDKYVRMQIPLTDANDDLDDASEKNMDELKLLAAGYLRSTEGRRAVREAIELIT